MPPPLHPPSTAVHSLVSLLNHAKYEWAAAILVIIATGCMQLFPVSQRTAYTSDMTISYDFRSAETVPNWMLAVISLVLPFVVISGFSMWKRSVYDWHKAMLGFAICVTFTLLVTQCLKNATGRLRPDFLSRCQGQIGTDYFRTMTNCTGDPSVVKEGRKSFPSGHSSSAFGGLGYLALYLWHTINLSRPPLTIKYFICIIPLIGASLVAISRTVDHWHHWQDVVVGSLIGIVIAFLSWRQYCPMEMENGQAIGDIALHSQQSEINNSTTGMIPQNGPVEVVVN